MDSLDSLSNQSPETVRDIKTLNQPLEEGDEDIVRGEHTRRMTASLWQSIDALVSAINERVFIPGHSSRTAKYALIIARTYGYSGEGLAKIKLGALMHDIGQIIYPDTILNMEPGVRLSPEENLIIQSHTTRGVDFVQGYSELNFLIPYIRDHQERIDGSGYTRGIKDEEIPIEVQIVSLADQYEAIRFPRGYQMRTGRTHEETIEILRQSSDSRWNKELFERFVLISAEWD